MPRTTLDLDRTVLGELRRRGRREGKSMGRMASELLAGALDADEDPEAPPGRFALRTRRLGRPRVDLEDKDAVWAVLDSRD